MKEAVQTAAPTLQTRQIRTVSPYAGFLCLAALVALLGAAKAILADTIDPDCFWHLRVGDELARQSWPHPLVDDLSFSSLKTPWTPYSWLAELGMKALWDHGGYRAAVAVQAVMQWLFLMMLALAGVEASELITGRRRYVASALCAFAGGILSLAYLSFRPVDMAMVLLAIIAWLLLRDRRLHQESRAVWFVPLITALIANLHFYSLLVPLWTGALFVGDVIEKRSPRRGGALLVTTLIASLMTPMLPGTLATVWHYAFHDVLVNSGHIAEMGPFYGGLMGHISLIIVCLTLIFAFWRRSQIGWSEILWLAGSTLLLLKLGRMAPVFAMIGCPILAATMPELSDRILKKPPILIGAALVLLIGFGKLVLALPPADKPISQWLNRHGPDCPSYPCGAADFVDQHVTPHSGRVICEFSWGGYLEWRLPKFQMLMDGRTQVFPAEFWKETFFGTPDDHRRIVEQSNADAAVLPKQHSMFQQTLVELNWKKVFEDDYAQVWLPPGS
jgi:hypothetical protein